MATTPQGGAVSLPTAPWYQATAAMASRSRSRQIGAVACLVITMGALFAFGHALGARGEFDTVALLFGVAGLSMFYAVTHLHDTPAPAEPASDEPAISYSEEAILTEWPVRTVSE